MPAPLSAVQYVVTDAGCWEWQRTRNQDGYGRMSVAGRLESAHRVMYVRHRGPIPEGHELDHLCRNPPCCNPDHLEPVTHTENIRRGAATKLTPEDVEAILASRETNVALGRRFGVSDARISQIRRAAR